MFVNRYNTSSDLKVEHLPRLILTSKMSATCIRIIKEADIVIITSTCKYIHSTTVVSCINDTQYTLHIVTHNISFSGTGPALLKSIPVNRKLVKASYKFRSYRVHKSGLCSLLMTRKIQFGSFRARTKHPSFLQQQAERQEWPMKPTVLHTKPLPS